MQTTRLIFSSLLISIASLAHAQNPGGVPNPSKIDNEEKQAETPKKWFDKINVRGYTQLRYNQVLENSSNTSEKNWGENNGFALKRVRVVLYGWVHPRVYFYIQPEFAGSIGNGLNIAQLRDAYFDLGLDKKNEFRLRIGQSKVPYGFENLQSSSNRLPLDRTDGISSAMPGERDAGVFFYWAPKNIRDRFSMLTKEGYKGSGDYGVFGFGVYTGQTANKPELNNEPHYVARLSYPFLIGSQIIEPGIQAYTGQYEIPKISLSKGVKYQPDLNYIDQRVGASFILYPRPFGIQAEYNIGRGPEFNNVTDSIEVQNLTGGYATFCYMIHVKKQLIYPFARIHYYEGGKKQDLDARSYKVNELEIGIEWLPVKQFELALTYTAGSRNTSDFVMQNNFQKGNMIRIQAQVNY